MTHKVLMTVFNQNKEQLDLSKRALESVLKQDIPVEVVVADNGSADGGETRKWLKFERSAHPRLIVASFDKNISPVQLTNRILREWCNPHVLCVPNDVVLPPNLYREFLKSPRGVVTGSMTESTSFPQDHVASEVGEDTPLCVVLWRKWVIDAVTQRYGDFFDPRFFNYCSDCDLALRMAALGIRGVQLDIQYWHYGSASHRLVHPVVGNAMRAQADVDRKEFEKKWGFKVTDPRYSELARDLKFRGEIVG